MLANHLKNSKMKGSDSMIKPAVSGDKILSDFLLLILAGGKRPPLTPQQPPYANPT